MTSSIKYKNSDPISASDTALVENPNLFSLIEQMELDEVKNIFNLKKKLMKNSENLYAKTTSSTNNRKKHPNRGNFFNYVWHG